MRFFTLIVLVTLSSGSIKALQMWADPEVEPALRKRQQASAQAIANNLRIVRPANKPNSIQNGGPSSNS